MITQTLPAGQLNCKAIQALETEIFRAQALAGLLCSASGMQALEQLDESFRVALFAHHADHIKNIRADIDSFVEQPGVDECVAEVLWAADNSLAEAEAVACMMVDADAINRLIQYSMSTKVAIAAGHAAQLGNVLTIIDQLDA